MKTQVYVVTLRVRLRAVLDGPDGQRIVGYFRKHWVTAPGADLAVAAAADGVTDGIVEAEASKVECAGASVEVDGEKLRAGPEATPRVLRRTGRILFSGE